MIRIIKWLFNRAWKQYAPYGYCDGFNYQTCVAMQKAGETMNCPYAVLGHSCMKGVNNEGKVIE
jgi:hypothetical protein